MTPILELVAIEHRFTRKLDVAAQVLNALGARYRERVVHALDGVNVTVQTGEVLAVVGESGCGKSTLGRIATGVLGPSVGTVLYKGRRVGDLRGGDRQAWVRSIQMVFQDPMTSLNPRRTVRDLVAEAPLVHGLVSRADQDGLVDRLLEDVGLDPALKSQRPHQLSGGQRQRVGIARALGLSPEVLVCDEATASLDVSMQAQVLNMFLDLKDRLGLTYLFISHNLGAVRHVANRVAVMYLGRIVEIGTADDIFRRPLHPYTQALLRAAPSLLQRRDFMPIVGEVASPIQPPSGCHFHPRCPIAFARCAQERPMLQSFEGTSVACHAAETGPCRIATIGGSGRSPDLHG